MTRISDTFAALKVENKAAFVAYLMGGDPDFETSLAIMQEMPAAGVDIIELGIPFTDPMADGPVIQAAGQRALKAGQTLKRTLDMVREFRMTNYVTPVVLMGYYNPIYAMGVAAFLKAASEAGVDGLIIVDLPPEEDEELCLPARKVGLDFIRLATPTTDAKRLPQVLRNASGFVYFVSMTGITGTKSVNTDAVKAEVSRLKAETDLPIVVGFGVRTEDDARVIGSVADGVVVGSAIVDVIASTPPADRADITLGFISALAEGVHSARKK